MGVTYTAARVRDDHRAAAFSRQLDTGHALLLATSAVCVLAIGMAYLGRTRTIPGPDAGGAPALLVPGLRAEALEPALRGAFTASQDRRFVARELIRFLEERPEPSSGLAERGVAARDPRAGDERGSVPAGDVRRAAARGARGGGRGRETSAGLASAPDVRGSRSHQATPGRQDRRGVQINGAPVAGRIPAGVLCRARACGTCAGWRATACCWRLRIF